MVKADTFAKYAMYNRKNPFIRMQGVQHKIPHRYVCPNCYGLTMTDTRVNDPVKRYQTCILCGWHGPKEATMTLTEVLEKETVKKGGKLYLR